MKLITASKRINELRSSKEYKEWRIFILKRDKNRCVICKSKNNLEIDHIKPVALFPHLAIDKNNGRVLCKVCHKKTDTYGAFSKFKGDSPIHPILSGDLLFKLQALPQMIEIWGKSVGFSLVYNPLTKKWRAGYKFAKVNLTSNEETIEQVIDDIFDKLKDSTYYKVDQDLLKSNK